MRLTPDWVAALRVKFDEWANLRVGLAAALFNTGWLFADKALRMAIGVLVGAWMARYLAPEQFGEIAYVLSFVAIFSVIAQLGLDGVAIRDIVRSEQDAPEILGTALRMRFLAGLFAWAAAVLLMKCLRPSDGQALLLTAIAAAGLAFQSAETVDLWFQSKVQSRRSIVPKALAHLAANSLKVGLIVARAPLAAFVLVGVVELALAAALLHRAYLRFPTAGAWFWRPARARLLWRECAPLPDLGVGGADLHAHRPADVV